MVAEESSGRSTTSRRPKPKKAPARSTKAKRAPASKSPSTRSAAFTAIEARLLEHARAFPGAFEDYPWGERVMKVNKKVFVFFGQLGGNLTVTCKLPKSGATALMAPFASPTGYGLGKSGWVTSVFQEGDDVPVPLLLEWITESYDAIASKKNARAKARAPR